MTYEEAIKVLENTKVMLLKGSGTDLQEACQMAIEALKKQNDFEILKKVFRAEYEEKYEYGIEDCVNWADWLDCIIEEIKEGK